MVVLRQREIWSLKAAAARQGSGDPAARAAAAQRLQVRARLIFGQAH